MWIKYECFYKSFVFISYFKRFVQRFTVLIILYVVLRFGVEDVWMKKVFWKWAGSEVSPKVVVSWLIFHFVFVCMTNNKARKVGLLFSRACYIKNGRRFSLDVSRRACLQTVDRKPSFRNKIGQTSRFSECNSTVRARISDQSAGLTFTCPQIEVNDNLAISGVTYGQEVDFSSRYWLLIPKLPP